MYNTLSNALIEIDSNIKNIFESLIKERCNIDEEIINDDKLYELLIDKRFIVENDNDEFLIYKSIISNYRNLNNLNITIAPTMDCNYSCHYCFENNEKKYIGSEVIDSIVEYIKFHNDVNVLDLTWFGGEPLMAIDKMTEFYKKMKIVFNKEFKSNIITNAYFITPKILKQLEDIEMKYLLTFSIFLFIANGSFSQSNEIENKLKLNETDFSFNTFNLNAISEYKPQLNMLQNPGLTIYNYPFNLNNYSNNSIIQKNLLGINSFNYQFFDHINYSYSAGFYKDLLLNKNVNLRLSSTLRESYYGINRQYGVFLNGQLTLDLNENIRLMASGQYRIKDNESLIYMHQPGENNLYGGGIIIRITDKIGLQCGIQRELYLGKWMTSYYVLPYFY